MESVLRNVPAVEQTHYEPTEADWAAVRDEDYRDYVDYTNAREHLDHSKTLTLAELVERQAQFFAARDNAAGKLLELTMLELSLKIAMVDATTPEEYQARIEVLDLDISQDQYDRGYLDGRASVRDQPLGSIFGHDA